MLIRHSLAPLLQQYNIKQNGNWQKIVRAEKLSPSKKIGLAWGFTRTNHIEIEIKVHTQFRKCHNIEFMEIVCKHWIGL